MTTESLQNQIEMLNLQLQDQAEMVSRVHDLEFQLMAQKENWNKYAIASVQLLEAEHKIVQLKKDLAAEIKKRDNFRNLVAQQDKSLNELERQVKAYKEEKRVETDELKRQLQTKTQEADHLARQAIRLNEETEKFKEQNKRFMEENRKLHDKSQDLEEELKLYRKMTTHQNMAINMAYPYFRKMATRFFSFQSTRDALANFEFNKKRSEDVAVEIRKFHDKPTEQKPPSNSSATPSPICNLFGS